MVGGRVIAHRRVVIVGALVVLLAGLVILALSFVYNPDYATRFLLDQVEQQLGRKIEVGQTHLQLFPVRLQLSDVVVRDVEPSQVFFMAKHVDLQLRVFPLLRQRVVWKRLAIEQPRLELRRNTAGRWNILTGTDAIQVGGNPLSLVLLIRETILTNGEITVVDEFRPDGVRSVRLSAVEATLSAKPKGPPTDVRLSATVPGDHGISALTITGRITKAETPIGLSPEASPETAPRLQFSGYAEALNVNIRQMADFFGPRLVPDRVQGSANLRSQVSVRPGIAGYDVVLFEMTASIEPIAISGQASLSGLMTAQPTFSLTFSSSPVSLEELLNHFPADWVHPQLQTVLTERGITGSVEAVSVSVSGSTVPEARVSMTGEFHVQHVQALVGPERTPVRDLAATVVIEPDRIRVVDLTGVYGTAQVTGGKAMVAFLDIGPWLDLEMQGSLAAPDLVLTVAKTVTSKRLSSTLAALREISGEALVTVRLAGPLRDPDHLRFVSGEFLARTVGFRSPALPERVEELNGRILFSSNGVRFDGVSGRLGQSRFEVQGTITTGESSTFQGFTVQGSADIAQVIRLLPAERIPSTALEGSIGITVALSGPTNAPRAKGMLELAETQLSIPGLLYKPAGTPAHIEFEGGLSPSSRISVDRLELILPPYRLAGKGTMRMGKKFSLDATLHSGVISVAGLPRGVSLGRVEAGTLEVSLDVKGKGHDWKAWQITGWVALTDGLVSGIDQGQKLTNLYLRLRLVRNGAELKRLEFRIKDSDVRLSGVIKDWNRHPDINLTIESAQLDLDLLIPKGERSPVRDYMEDLAATGRLAATIGINGGMYKQFAFTDLSGRLNIANGRLEMDQIKGQSGGGTVTGQFLVHLPKHKPSTTDASFQVRDLPFEEFTHVLGATDHPIIGDLSLTGSLQGTGKHPQGVSHTLNGKAELLIKQGRIQRFTVISKVLSILNLPTLLAGKVDLTKDGLPFDKITGTFLIKNGQVTTEDLVVDSPVMKISAAGHYDVPTNQLDFVMAISPFGSYSQFLKNIPLFGKLFAGERKGIDTALFEVKGLLQNPEVKYLPLQSFATGLTGLAHLAFDVLKNTLLLPKELIAPEEPATESQPGAPESPPASQPPATESGRTPEPVSPSLP